MGNSRNGGEWSYTSGSETTIWLQKGVFGMSDEERPELEGERVSKGKSRNKNSEGDS